jgi:hypothetical protein
MGRDQSLYAFAAPATGGPVTVAAELRFRRTFQGVMEAKGWNSPDIMMEMVEVDISLGQPSQARIGLPLGP